MPPEARRTRVATWSQLEDRVPTYAIAGSVDLVVVRYGDAVSVLYGRCLHRGALMADGRVEGDNLICGVHDWDYRLDTGVSEYNNAEALPRFEAWVDVEADAVFVSDDEIAAFERKHPQPFRREEYLGLYQDPHGTADEPYNNYIQALARDGLSRVGHHGPVSAMGVALTELPRWSDLQVLTAQVATRPLLDDAPVGTDVVVGPRAAKPLRLEIPLFVSDMSYGALSEEAKVALAKGAELAGTGICSGEGGMLPDEQEANSRYFYELASGRFGWSLDKVSRCQAFHFKGGQGAKTGTGGHLPGHKVVGRIAEVRGLEPGQPAVSPATFPDLETAADFRRVADEVREATGGIPVGFKLSAQHIEADLDFALEVGVDYVILDGRGGGTGAAPNVFKQNISVPTMAALARARRHLDRRAPRRHARRDRRPAHRRRLREGHGARRRCGRAVELGPPGDRLPRHARLPHQQLPGRDRDAEGGPPGAPRGRALVPPARQLPRGERRSDEDPGARLRARAPARVPRRRPHLVEARRGGALRRLLRRGGLPGARRWGVSWVRLGAVAPGELVEARLVLHHAAQLVGTVGPTLLEPEPEYGHYALAWDADMAALVTPVVPGTRPFRVGLAFDGLELFLSAPDGRRIAARSLAGTTLAESLSWLTTTVGAEVGELPGLELAQHDLPEHPVRSGAPFATPDGAAVGELARWFGDAAQLLGAVAAERADGAPVRVWPHHFDPSVFHKLDPELDAETARSFTLGMSPGDGTYAQPYFYVTSFPSPERGELADLGTAGGWHTDGWIGAVLTGSELVALDDQEGAAGGFLRAAIEQAKRRLDG